jgi:hypothetical protein
MSSGYYTMVTYISFQSWFHLKRCTGQGKLTPQLPPKGHLKGEENFLNNEGIGLISMAAKPMY